jgi:hypothetical protein
VTLGYRSRSDASAERAWELVARPQRWHEWAPHVRGARGLGSPEVEAGARGAVLLLGGVPVPVRITDKRPGRSWSWRVGVLEIAHRVEPRGRGCSVAVELRGPAAVVLPLRFTYGPLVAVLVRNLAHVASS